MSTNDTEPRNGKSRAPAVKSLDAIKVGDTEAAKLCEKILREQYGEVELASALDTLAERLFASPWSVYRWLRGERVPRQYQLHALREAAGDSTAAA